MMNALFCQTDNHSNIKTPETFIAFLNTDLINQIKQKFGVNSQSKYYFEILTRLETNFKLIGVDKDHPLEQYKNYFDTSRLFDSAWA